MPSQRWDGVLSTVLLNDATDELYAIHTTHPSTSFHLVKFSDIGPGKSPLVEQVALNLVSTDNRNALALAASSFDSSTSQLVVAISEKTMDQPDSSPFTSLHSFAISTSNSPVSKWTSGVHHDVENLIIRDGLVIAAGHFENITILELGTGKIIRDIALKDDSISTGSWKVTPSGKHVAYVTKDGFVGVTLLESLGEAWSASDKQHLQRVSLPQYGSESENADWTIGDIGNDFVIVRGRQSLDWACIRW